MSIDDSDYDVKCTECGFLIDVNSVQHKKILQNIKNIPKYSTIWKRFPIFHEKC